MSKKKHKNTNYQNHTNLNEVDNEIINEEVEECEESETDEELIEDINHVNSPEEILEQEVKAIDEKVEPVVKFYRVGTDYARNKCVNQVNYTTDLEIAKAECLKARDKNNKTYHVFDKEGNAVYTAEYNIPRDNYYRVGTDWKNSRCINQKFYTVNLDEACKVSNDNTKTSGLIHNVYDPSGKIVFSSKKKLTLLSHKKREVNKNADWYIK